MEKKKIMCKRDDSRGKLLLWFVLGATWGTLECAYNRYNAINSFLLSLLLAPPVVWYVAGGMVLAVRDSVVCSWFQSIESLVLDACYDFWTWS